LVWGEVKNVGKVKQNTTAASEAQAIFQVLAGLRDRYRDIVIKEHSLQADKVPPNAPKEKKRPEAQQTELPLK
jgi:hypothetical protein